MSDGDADGAGTSEFVATTAGGIPEVVLDGTTGFLVPPRDHEAMADAIVRLLRDEALRRHMGAAGEARVRQRFRLRGAVDEPILRWCRQLGSSVVGTDGRARGNERRKRGAEERASAASRA